ncbi:MAG: hypothetical protein HOC63_15720 [Rhodospirillales bacterium]|jgi:ribonuclease G|nr:hypothetical protein [Rhodospirillales bacterium]MBT4040943.1 hypothetical protein [Rhodospirillales bacterium]MBT4628122.1 hypothetical protein [Rhodospirillales bacterium]MBT5350307.1 hypothetical protein [Rhodospirillales bacterium]MBT6111400.1 hypothetical protein [Rhodospirillales bacterium]
MSQQRTTILIDALTSEHRIARMCGDVLVDVQITRPGAGSQVGDIILARIKAVVPGIKGAFVDVGDVRDGFLPFSEKTDQPALSEGQTVVVQVRNEAMADKGARLTSQVSITGRYSVYTPGRAGINVSRKSGDAELAAQFQALAGEICGPGDGVIVRTAALEAGEAAFEPFTRELTTAHDRWMQAQVQAQSGKSPAVLLAAPDAITATLTALDATESVRVVVEGVDAWVDAQKRVPPYLSDVLSQHTGPTPLFESYGVESQLDAALGTVAMLPSGGRLHIVDTPACVTVDVDSAGASAGGNRQAVIRQTNIEAARKLARELRLRNLSGNIVVDFISSTDRGDGAALLDLLKAESAGDPVPVEIKGFSRLGLVEMIRRRRAPSLADVLCSGAVKSPLTLAYNALRMAYAQSTSAPGRAVTIRAHDHVISVLKKDLAADVTHWQQSRGSTLKLEGDGAMAVDDLDVYADH